MVQSDETTPRHRRCLAPVDTRSRPTQGAGSPTTYVYTTPSVVYFLVRPERLHRVREGLELISRTYPGQITAEQLPTPPQSPEH